MSLVSWPLHAGCLYHNRILMRETIKLILSPMTFDFLPEPCPEFYCKGGEYCIDSSELLCNPLPRYCIAQSLRCNNIPNCGAGDSSDEDGCKYSPQKLNCNFISLFPWFSVLTSFFCRYTEDLPHGSSSCGPPRGDPSSCISHLSLLQKS